MPIEREHCIKGGQNVPPEKRSFSRNRELAAEAGKRSQRKLAERCGNCGTTYRECLRLRKSTYKSIGMYSTCCSYKCTHKFK